MTGAGPGEGALSRDFTGDTLVEVRREVERRAERHGMSGVALYRFVVAVNELTTNAVRHGGGRGRLDLWSAGARLLCRVTDHGPGLPSGYEIRRPASDASDGRGLWLARQGGEDLAVQREGDSTVITLTGAPVGLPA
jgi:anti-sigma regulatory factor (Ser/Thr protein kinase)